jgi:hypothetical protein
MQTKNERSAGYVGLIVLLICVALVWGASWYYLKDVADRGTFGDMFGAINALFSGLAFAGVIYAILLQKNELSLQRDELELTRNELKGQKLQMQVQNETFKRQNFENTFFSLLDQHNSIINNLEIEVGIDESRLLKGRDCFRTYFEKFRQFYWIRCSDNNDCDDVQKLERAFIELRNYPQGDVGHYFRNMYNILKFINNSQIEHKRLYSNILRAQLSSHELALLFYNCLTSNGVEKFKPLIEKFTLLKNLSEDLIIDKEKHKNLYKISAYKTQLKETT